MKSLLQTLGYFIVKNLLSASIIFSVSSVALFQALAWPLELALTLSAVLVIALSAWLERFYWHRSDWRESKNDFRNDLLSFIILIALSQPLMKWVVSILAVFAAQQGLTWTVFWNQHLAQMPMALQVILAWLWIELATYWMHRLHHLSKGLWWLHALHHSSERLYWLNGFRVNPLEFALKALASVLPLLLLGVPAEVLIWVVALAQPVQVLQHVNLPLKNGWLNWIFSSNELHRWHHSAQTGEGEVNFGSSLVLWDHAFGTYRRAGEPQKVGLYAVTNYPAQASLGRIIGSMLRLKCCS